MRTLLLSFLIAAAVAVPSSPASTRDSVQAANAQDPVVLEGPTRGDGATPAASPRADSLGKPALTVAQDTTPRRNPLAGEPDDGARGTWDRGEVPIDPLIAVGTGRAPHRTPDLGLSFDGIGNPVACSG